MSSEKCVISALHWLEKRRQSKKKKKKRKTKCDDADASCNAAEYDWLGREALFCLCLCKREEVLAQEPQGVEVEVEGGGLVYG